MAKHRFPVRVRAMRGSIKSGRRLLIIGATILAMGGAGVGYAMADTTHPNFPYSNCDASHGAPGGFPVNSTAISNQNDPGFGHEQNAAGQGANNLGNTGSNNSDLGQSCAPGR
jgi:hypothetical protein